MTGPGRKRRGRSGNSRTHSRKSVNPTDMTRRFRVSGEGLFSGGRAFRRENPERENPKTSRSPGTNRAVFRTAPSLAVGIPFDSFNLNESRDKVAHAEEFLNQTRRTPDASFRISPKPGDRRVGTKIGPPRRTGLEIPGIHGNHGDPDNVFRVYDRNEEAAPP